MKAHLIRIVLLLFIFQSICWGKSYSLKKCVELAVKNNPQIRAYMEEESYQRAQTLLAYSELFPKIYLSLDYIRQGETHIPPYNTYSYTISSSWEIFSGFSTLYTIEESKLLELASKRQTRRVMLDVAQDVVEAYLDALTAQKKLIAAQNYLKRSRYFYRLTESKYRVGLVSRADLLHARYQLTDAKYQVVSRKKEYEKAVARLLALMNRDVSENVTLKEVKPIIVDYSFSELFSLAKQLSPEISEAEARVRAQERRIAAVRGEFFPKVTLSTNWGKRDESLFPDDRRFWSVEVNINLPVFTGLSTWHKLKREKAELERLKFNLREATLNVELSVWNAYQDYERAKEKLEVAKDNLDAAREDWRVSLKKYKVNLISVVDLTTIEANLYKAESDYYEALHEVLLSYYSLVRAVGKIPVLEGL